MAGDQEQIVPSSQGVSWRWKNGEPAFTLLALATIAAIVVCIARPPAMWCAAHMLNGEIASPPALADEVLDGS